MRRSIFIKGGALIFFVVVVGLAAWMVYGSMQTKSPDLHPAKYYEKLENGSVRCNLCPNRCALAPGDVGFCRSRKNVDGDLYSLVYGKVAARHVDPIEKKPFYHVLPGSRAYSIATNGCNLRCLFCQNWQIAQIEPGEGPAVSMTPAEVVGDALKSGAKSIAFTYNEPTIFYEYMLDIARLAHQKGLKTVVVSAGYINPEPLNELLPHVDAYKIDLKGFSEAFYEKMTHGHLQPVLNTIKRIREKGVWLEIVNLVIPGENDSDQIVRGMIDWIKTNVGTDVPVHFTRFHPDYKLTNTPATPIDTLKKARRMAMDAGLKFVYTGNVMDVEGSTTYCPKSNKPAIVRQGFFVTENNLTDGKCPDGGVIPGVWK